MRKLIALAGLALILECVRLAPKPPRGMPADRLIAALRGRLPRAPGQVATSVKSGAGRPTQVTAMPHARAAQAPATG